MSSFEKCADGHIDLNILIKSDSKGNRHIDKITEPTGIIDVETGLMNEKVIYQVDIDKE